MDIGGVFIEISTHTIFQLIPWMHIKRFEMISTESGETTKAQPLKDFAQKTKVRLRPTEQVLFRCYSGTGIVIHDTNGDRVTWYKLI